MTQTPLPRKVRGIRDTIPSGYLLGRSSGGNGKTELVPFAKVASKLLATGAIGPPNQPGTGGSPAWFGLTLVKPTASLYTAVNPGTSTFVDTIPGVFLKDNTGLGDIVRLLTVSAPATPYSFTAGILTRSENFVGSAHSIMLGWYDGTNKIQSIAQQGTNLRIMNWSTPSSFSSNVLDVGDGNRDIIFHKIRDDGTNVTFSVSIDGTNFVPFYTVAKSSGFLGATGYSKPFVGMDVVSSSGWVPPNMTVVHWVQGT